MYKIDDPEVIAFIEKTEEFYPADANLASVQENRRLYDAMCAAFRQPRPATMKVKDGKIQHVPIRTYTPEHVTADTQIIYLHGGSLVLGSRDSHDDVCAEIADASGLILTSVDYRLAPEHAFPAPLDDVETVWDALSCTTRRIIVMGDSAGGHLSAGLCLRLRRLGKPMPIGQILIYPGLGGDLSLPAYQENANAPLLRTKDIQAYRAGVREVPVDAADAQEIRPLRTMDFSGLPPTYVFTADIDPLRDDGRIYVERLRAAGINAWWRNDAQLVHGYLRGRHTSRRIAMAFRAICASVSVL